MRNLSRTLGLAGVALVLSSCDGTISGSDGSITIQSDMNLTTPLTFSGRFLMTNIQYGGGDDALDSVSTLTFLDSSSGKQVQVQDRYPDDAISRQNFDTLYNNVLALKGRPDTTLTDYPLTSGIGQNTEIDPASSSVEITVTLNLMCPSHSSVNYGPSMIVVPSGEKDIGNADRGFAPLRNDCLIQGITLSPPGGNGLAAFQSGFWATARVSCGACHGVAQPPQFAESDLNTSYVNAKTYFFSDRTDLNPSAVAQLVSHLNNGHCGSYCDGQNTSAVVSEIDSWQAAEISSSH